MNLFEISIPQMTRTLGQARVWLDKAQAHADHKKFDSQVLWTARLAPDQWHFTRQIYTITLAPLRFAAVMRGREPTFLPELEPNLEALRERIDGTLGELQALRAEEFEGAEARMIPLPFAPNKGMQAPAFVVEFALPNFYFHATTAYSILRHNGVELGKFEFLGPIAIRDL